MSRANSHAAVYRIDPAAPPKKGFLRIELNGSLENKLSVWQVVGTPVVGPVCQEPEQALERVELKEGAGAVHRVFCVPAYEQELEPIHRGLSLLEGGETIEIKGMALEEPWHLRLSVQACGFGERVLAQVELGRKEPTAPAPVKLSCDLKLLAS